MFVQPKNRKAEKKGKLKSDNRLVFKETHSKFKVEFEETLALQQIYLKLYFFFCTELRIFQRRQFAKCQPSNDRRE